MYTIKNKIKNKLNVRRSIKITLLHFRNKICSNPINLIKNKISLREIHSKTFNSFFSNITLKKNTSPNNLNKIAKKRLNKNLKNINSKIGTRTTLKLIKDQAIIKICKY